VVPNYVVVLLLLGLKETLDMEDGEMMNELSSSNSLMGQMAASSFVACLDH
jgi:roadblock/LC7 domain-containing protein